MRRGELYRVAHPSAKDPKRHRIFCIVSRQVLIDSKYSTVICAPVYTAYDGLATQVPLGVEDGLKHDCSIHCDNLISLQKASADQLHRHALDREGRLTQPSAHHRTRLAA